MQRIQRRIGFILLGAAGLALTASGCAHVSQEDLDNSLQELRQEMEQADRQNAERIDGVDDRVSALESRIDGLEEQLRSFRDEFDVTVERLETALRFSTPIHFAFDEAEVRQQDRKFLDRFAGVVKDHYADATITVEGFTDPAGSEAYNLRLGKRRADAVKGYLVETGNLSADRIRTVSYGESTDRLMRSEAAGPGQQGWENRRVVMVVDFRPGVATGSVAEGSNPEGR